MFNYTPLFLLLYCILSILGLPVSSLLAGAGIARGGYWYGGPIGFLSDVINGFSSSLNVNWILGDEVVLTNRIPITAYPGARSVSSVGIRTTQLRGRWVLHFVPQSESPPTVTNFSRTRLRPVILSNLLGTIERV